MLEEHERYYDFGMDALVIVCFRNTNIIIYDFGMDALVSVYSRDERNYDFGMALEPVATAVRGRRTYAAERILNPEPYSLNPKP